jgi:alkylhydroperoxidase/carboxymuconolactone decarboxylase family protein YurZ
VGELRYGKSGLKAGMKGLSTKQIATILGAMVVVAVVSTYFEALKNTLRVSEEKGSSSN